MNKKVVLASRPSGDVTSSNFKIVTESINTSIKLGEVLVRVDWISIDPAQRGN
jgi:NADPH-dependent curcumin reductase CurA